MNVKKCVTTVVLSGVLALSSLAATAQAAGRAYACCTRLNISETTEYSYGDPAPTYHVVWSTTTIRCKACGHTEVYENKTYEEHDYDIYDLENHRRYCKCGDWFSY